jgi:hypothetical protein
MAKMLAAVLLGGVIASLPGDLVRGITGVALGVAAALWREHG